MIYIALDATILFIATFVSVKYIRDPLLGLILLSSCVFIAHSTVNLIYGISGQPNASVVYQSVPILQTGHKALSLLILTYILINFLVILPRVDFFNLRILLGIIILAAAMHAIALIYSIQPEYDISFQDIIGQMLFLSLLAPLYCMRMTVDKVHYARAYFYFLAICALSVGVGVLEIALLRVQAATNYEQLGEHYRLIVAYRASGIFMNPNWAANWAAFFTAVSILVYQYGMVRAPALVGIALSVVIIFLSGSRGGMLTLLVASLILLAPGLQVPARRNLSVLLVATGTFFVANVTAFVANSVSPEGPISTRLYGLYFRWIIETQSIGTYAFQLLSFKLTGLAPPSATLSTAAEHSIIGRLDGIGADNGFLSFYSSGGPLGVAAIGIVFALCIAAIIRTVVISRRDSKAKRLISIAISGTLFVAILAMQLRAFSVFPLWIFASTILATVLSIPSMAQEKCKPNS